jgi:hypothetical protein
MPLQEMVIDCVAYCRSNQEYVAANFKNRCCDGVCCDCCGNTSCDCFKFSEVHTMGVPPAERGVSFVNVGGIDFGVTYKDDRNVYLFLLYRSNRKYQP